MKFKILIISLFVIPTCALAIGMWQSYFDFDHHLATDCIINDDTGTQYRGYLCKEATYYTLKTDVKGGW